MQQVLPQGKYLICLPLLPIHTCIGTEFSGVRPKDVKRGVPFKVTMFVCF